MTAWCDDKLEKISRWYDRQLDSWGPWYEAKLTEPWMKKYFSFRGRLNRKPYILRGILLSIIGSLVEMGILALAVLISGKVLVPILMTTLVHALFQLGLLSLAVRRLHDLGNGARGFGALNVILFLVNLLAETVKAFFGGMYPLFWTAGPGRFMLYGVMILLFVAALYLAFVYICLLFRKGTEGPNPFGADPLAPPAEE